MVGGNDDLEIVKGAVFARTYTWTNAAGTAIDLTSYTAALKVKAYPRASTTYVSLTHAAGITLGGAAGTVAISITGAVTGAYTWALGVWDLFLYSGTSVPTRLAYGLACTRESTTT